MSQPHMDHNDLARFLDGTMPEEERGSTVAHLSESDADAELLADAAYLLRDLEGQDGVTAEDDADTDHPHANDVDTGTDPKVVPLRPPSTGRTRPRRLPVRWLALAAVLAGVLLVPLALSRSGSRAPGDFATLLSNRGGGLPPEWVDRDRWGVNRGEGNFAADNALSAQLGALQVDLEVAAAAGQAEEIKQLTGRIAGKLGDMAGSGPVVAAYNDIGRRSGESAEALAAPLADAREGLAMFMEEDYFNLGAWTEAASLAVQRRDAAFFHARASRKMLDRASSLSSIDQEARRAINGIRASTREGELDWIALESHTRALLASIGS